MEERVRFPLFLFLKYLNLNISLHSLTFTCLKYEVLVLPHHSTPGRHCSAKLHTLSSFYLSFSILQACLIPDGVHLRETDLQSSMTDYSSKKYNVKYTPFSFIHKESLRPACPAMNKRSLGIRKGNYLLLLTNMIAFCAVHAKGHFLKNSPIH